MGATERLVLFPVDLLGAGFVEHPWVSLHTITIAK